MTRTTVYNPESAETTLCAWLSGAEVHPVQLSSPEDFTASSRHGLAALISPTEIGTAFTLRHPE